MTPADPRAKAKALRAEAADLLIEAERIENEEALARIAAQPLETATPIALADLCPGVFYRARGSDQTVPGEDFPFVLRSSPPYGLIVWGFSVYRRSAGYRTLGSTFAEWASQPGNAGMLVYADRDRRLDKRPRSPVYRVYP